MASDGWAGLFGQEWGCAGAWHRGKSLERGRLRRPEVEVQLLPRWPFSAFWASEDYSDSSWLGPWLNTPTPPCPQVRGGRRGDE